MNLSPAVDWRDVDWTKWCANHHIKIKDGADNDSRSYADSHHGNISRTDVADSRNGYEGRSGDRDL